MKTSQNVDTELKKIGLKLINVNVTDIKDESGYIEALGKEAAAKAINEAKISVAEQEKWGIRKALADREKDISMQKPIEIGMSKLPYPKDREVSIALQEIQQSGERDTRIKLEARYRG